MSGKSKAQLAREEESPRIAPGKSKPRDAWKPIMQSRAHDYALLGATNAEIAELLEVQTSTFENWLVEKKGLRAAVRRARVDANVRVVKSQYRAATGYTLRDERVKTNANGQVIEKTTQKRHFPPSTTAAVLVLTNRDPDRWKERKTVEHSGSISLAALVEGLHLPADPASQAKLVEAKPVTDIPDDVSDG